MTAKFSSVTLCPLFSQSGVLSQFLELNNIQCAVSSQLDVLSPILELKNIQSGIGLWANPTTSSQVLETSLSLNETTHLDTD